MYCLLLQLGVWKKKVCCRELVVGRANKRYVVVNGWWGWIMVGWRRYLCTKWMEVSRPIVRRSMVGTLCRRWLVGDARVCDGGRRNERCWSGRMDLIGSEEEWYRWVVVVDGEWSWLEDGTQNDDARVERWRAEANQFASLLCFCYFFSFPTLSLFFSFDYWLIRESSMKDFRVSPFLLLLLCSLWFLKENSVCV